MNSIRSCTSVLTLLSWTGFVVLDLLLRAVMWKAEKDASGHLHYGEMYGPLYEFRHLTLYGALAGSIVWALFVLDRALGKRWRP